MRRKPTRRQLLLAAMGVAVAALAAERGWIFQPDTSRAGAEDAPSSAAADGTGSPAASEAAGDSAENTGPAENAPDSPHNSALAVYRFTENPRDLFQPTPTILNALNDGRSTDPNHPDVQRRTAGDLKRTFLESHTLQATFTGPAGPSAIIDGKVRSVGDFIDGFEIVEIGGMRVRFRREDVTVVLVLCIAPGM